MSERRVRTVGRQNYGRVEPLSRGRRTVVRPPRFSGLQQRLIILLVIIMVILWGVAQLFALRTIRIDAPARVGEIQVEVQQEVDRSWWQRNLLTVDTEVLADELKQKDPQLKNVAVRRQWTHGLVVTTTLKQPSLAWATGNQQYVLDLDGSAIGVLPVDSKLLVVQDGSNLPVEVGARVASSRFIAFVTALAPALAAGGVGVAGYSVKDTTLDLYVQTNKGYQLIFDTSREVSAEVADLKAVQTLLSAQKRTPAKYIDLRVAGKAYYE